MAWEASTLWWVVTGVLVAAELGTGTFYLLMLALGAAAGALSAHAGLEPSVQAFVAAVVGAGAVAGWHFRPARRHHVPVAANRDINLDVGERVHVDSWNPDGTTRVQYRGAAWNARHAGGPPARAGDHVIQEVRHNELLLRHVG